MNKKKGKKTDIAKKQQRRQKLKSEASKAGKKTWEWTKRNRKLVLVLSIFLVGFISGGIVFSIVGEEEIELTPVGWAVSPYTQSGVWDTTDYVNLEEGTTTLAETNWHKDADVSKTYGTMRADSKSLEIDADLTYMGVPNVIANIPQNYYPCDASGDIIDEFDVNRVDRTFYDPTVDESREITFYNTWVGSQITMTIKADKNIDVSSYTGSQDKIGSGSTAEVDGTYNCLDGMVLNNDFHGYGVWCRIVFRTHIKAFAVGEAIHDDPYVDSWNGIWWSKITGVNVEGIESTQGWQGQGDWSGNLEQTEVGIYATCEDALFGLNQIPSLDSSTIQLEDTLQDHIYFALEYQVRLGYDFNTQKYISDGWVTDWANTPLKIQGWKVTLDICQYITTSYGAPLESGHTQEDYYDNPFVHEDLPDMDGWTWWNTIWQTPEIRRWIIIAIIAIVSIVAIIIFVKVLPLIIAKRKAKNLSGR